MGIREVITEEFVCDGCGAVTNDWRKSGWAITSADNGMMVYIYGHDNDFIIWDEMLFCGVECFVKYIRNQFSLMKD